MKQADSHQMRPEYFGEDLGKGVRGKYLEAFKSGPHLVLLQPDVARRLPADDSVNRTREK